MTEIASSNHNIRVQFMAPGSALEKKVMFHDQGEIRAKLRWGEGVSECGGITILAASNSNDPTIFKETSPCSPNGVSEYSQFLSGW
jgi:hypothetical protein